MSICVAFCGACPPWRSSWPIHAAPGLETLSQDWAWNMEDVWIHLNKSIFQSKNSELIQRVSFYDSTFHCLQPLESVTAVQQVFLALSTMDGANAIAVVVQGPWAVEQLSGMAARMSKCLFVSLLQLECASFALYLLYLFWWCDLVQASIKTSQLTWFLESILFQIWFWYSMSLSSA